MGTRSYSIIACLVAVQDVVQGNYIKGDVKTRLGEGIMQAQPWIVGLLCGHKVSVASFNQMRSSLSKPEDRFDTSKWHEKHEFGQELFCNKFDRLFKHHALLVPNPDALLRGLLFRTMEKGEVLTGELIQQTE